MLAALHEMKTLNSFQDEIYTASRMTLIERNCSTALTFRAQLSLPPAGSFVTAAVSVIFRRIYRKPFYMCTPHLTKDHPPQAVQKNHEAPECGETVLGHVTDLLSFLAFFLAEVLATQQRHKAHQHRARRTHKDTHLFPRK